MRNRSYAVLWAAMVMSMVLAATTAAAQPSPLYHDASRMYQQYKQNQAQIDALNRSIATHRAIIAGMNRDISSTAAGFGSYNAATPYTADLAAHREAIERELRQVSFLEHRQAIIETSWERNGHISGYYGSLKETHGRKIYDPKVRREVNLMDYRMQYFRNPGGSQSPPHARSPDRPVPPGYSPSSTSGRSSYPDRSHPPTSGNDGGSRRSDASRGPGSAGHNAPGRGDSSASAPSGGHGASSRSGPPNRTGSSSSSRSSGGSGGSHTITLTPVN